MVALLAACASEGGAAGPPPTSSAPVVGTTTGAPTTVPAPATSIPPHPGVPFWQSALWTTPIPDGAPLDPRSGPIAVYLSGSRGGIANLYDYGIPVYVADTSVPRVRIECRKVRDVACDVEADGEAPIPGTARPNGGTDRALVILDLVGERTWELWQATDMGDHWEVSWGTTNRFDGDGLDGGSGSGISRIGGMVTLDEVHAGEIPHALAFSSDNTCADTFRFPAYSTDGRSTRVDCIPEGTRVQLDPSIDLAAIADITPGELMVGRALQEYGAYVVDSGGSRMAFLFEHPKDGDDPYPAIGFAWDYYAMRNLPWYTLRVLSRWDGR